MSRLKHIHIEGYPYFVTTTTKANIALFSDTKLADSLLDCIYYGRENNWYHLLSFVIMPEHLHLVIVPQERNISQIMKGIKGFLARRINADNQNSGSVWQTGFYDYIIDTEEKLFTKIRYIEQNPGKRRLVSKPALYRYSSAYEQNLTDLDFYLNGKKAGQECPAYPE
ncbi:MAG: transposase [Candidatus Omnitrophica bacterium]|nr:transposase [Candidatus Omnitrophota bacterium]